jgi:hypothetical protein
VKKWLPRLHALVVGPGLGRDDLLLKNVKVSVVIGHTSHHTVAQSCVGLLGMAEMAKMRCEGRGEARPTTVMSASEPSPDHTGLLRS